MAGVTDVAGEQAFSWFSEPQPTVPHPLITAEPTPDEPPISTEVTLTDLQADKMVWTVGDAPALLVLAAAPYGTAQDALPLTQSEQVLLGNMLHAIGWQLEQVGFACVANTNAQGKPLNKQTAVALQEAYQACVTKHAANVQGVLVLGQVPWHVWQGEETALSSAREKFHDSAMTVLEKPAGLTYHPRALLKQPLLKRLAWQDLQSFQTKLKTH